MSTIKTRHFHLIEDLDIAAATYNLVERVEDFALLLRSTVSLWASRARDRRQLATMSDRMLRDIGLSRINLDKELSKSFWQK